MYNIWNVVTVFAYTCSVTKILRTKSKKTQRVVIFENGVMRFCIMKFKCTYVYFQICTRDKDWNSSLYSIEPILKHISLNKKKSCWSGKPVQSKENKYKAWFENFSVFQWLIIKYNYKYSATDTTSSSPN